MTMKPLEGIRVADFSWFGAGPIGAQTLATFGAEVVRVESETKIDSLRVVQPFALDEDGSLKTGYNVSGYFNNVNPGSSASCGTSTPRRAKSWPTAWWPNLTSF